MVLYESCFAVTHHSFGGDLLNMESLLIFNASFFFSLKFLLAIFFLILIRGGIPRYRYDYLTKLG
jgi:NADH:ubiquinone oxidoreductase subunit H